MLGMHSIRSRRAPAGVVVLAGALIATLAACAAPAAPAPTPTPTASATPSPTATATPPPTATPTPRATVSTEPTRWPIVVRDAGGRTYAPCPAAVGEPCVMAFADQQRLVSSGDRLSPTTPAPNRLLVWVGLTKSDTLGVLLVEPDGRGGATVVDGSSKAIASAWVDSTWIPGTRGRIVAGGCSNLRATPAMSGAVIECIPGSSEVAVLGSGPSADGHAWITVLGSGGFRGWMAADLVER